MYMLIGPYGYVALIKQTNPAHPNIRTETTVYRASFPNDDFQW